MAAGRKRLIPEVVQSSAMDCGPAALKAFIEGHGIPVSYGRLREACQTDVDGTAIETLEELATYFGLPAEQVLVPRDHVLLEDSRNLPAVAVFRLPNGNTHFAVIWNVFHGLVQVMDPASGRRWLTRVELMAELFEHRMEVAAEDWRDWAGAKEATAGFSRRLAAVGASAGEASALLGEALSDPDWRSLANLDAAIRAASAAGLGRDGLALARALYEKEKQEPGAIPESYFSARSVRQGEGAMLEVRGAVLVRPSEEPVEASSFSTRIDAARDETPERPLRDLLRQVFEEGWAAPSLLVAASFASAAAVAIEALLYRSLIELLPRFGLTEHRVFFLAAVILFTLLVLGLDLATVTGELRLGRRLETRLRLALQRKVARLSDRYFRSRLVSDMAERNHSSHLLRTAPQLTGQVARVGFELVLTAGAIVWLAPATAPFVLLTLVAALAIPIAGQRLLHERDLRVRSHLGGLSRFYLDALLGLVPLRAHGAEPAMREEHEALLVQWARARLGLQRVAVSLSGAQFLAGYGLIVLLLFTYLRGGGETAAVLLLAYWALNLPVLGLELVSLCWRYPALRNVSLRLGEPLRALEETEVAPKADGSSSKVAVSGGMSLRFEGVNLRPAGHAILQAIDLAIEPGSHVAIVGPSGAGKTSLLGLPLGWHFPDEGRVVVDGGILSGDRLASVRREIAWVDPEVQIWNRSFVENLRYGNDLRDVASVIELADLLSVLQGLPEGESTPLGEGGGLVSGGEGQRVRLARAFLRTKVRLALLDEPFRGLDRERRGELLDRARRLWKDATLLCVTHDIAEAEGFDRVLVLEAGRLVEDGSPKALLEAPGSRFARLREADRELEALWSESSWRRFRLREGRIDERPRA